MEDRRIRKTKKAFYAALIELLKENELRNIGVQELCDLADSHRSTFYYHYSDIYALYDELESKILDDFSSVVSVSTSHSYDGVYDNIISHLADKRDVWIVLLGRHGNPNFKNKVSGILENKHLEIWKYETGREAFSEEFHILSKASISAFIALFTEWLNSDSAGAPGRIKKMLGDLDAAFDTVLEKYI